MTNILPGLADAGSDRRLSVCGRWSKVNAQLMPNITTTNVIWDTEHDDDFGFGVAGQSGLVVPVGMAGRYLLSLMITSDNGGMNGQRNAYIHVDGVAVAVGACGPTYSSYATTYAQAVVPLRPGQAIYGQFYHNVASGGINVVGTATAGLLMTQFSIARIGDA